MKKIKHRLRDFGKTIKAFLKWGKQDKMFFWCMVGFLTIALIHVAVNAFAWTIPSSGSFAYDVYDIAINKIAKGPIGFVAGSGCLGGALFAATRSAWVPAGTLAVASGILFKLDSIATSLGYII